MYWRMQDRVLYFPYISSTQFRQQAITIERVACLFPLLFPSHSLSLSSPLYVIGIAQHFEQFSPRRAYFQTRTELFSLYCPEMVGGWQRRGGHVCLTHKSARQRRWTRVSLSLVNAARLRPHRRTCSHRHSVHDTRLRFAPLIRFLYFFSPRITTLSDNTRGRYKIAGLNKNTKRRTNIKATV